MKRHIRTITAGMAVLLTASLVSGCAADSYAARGAASGAGTGGLAAAVGAAATALIFGGDVGEAAARGAVYGAASGAVVGGISGAQADQRVAAEEQAANERRLQQFRQKIGDDAFNGFVALAECKYEVALANAREAQKSSKRDHALAGLWVEGLSEADRDGVAAAGATLEAIVEQDRDVDNMTQAEARLSQALDKLAEIRTEHELPPSCVRS